MSTTAKVTRYAVARGDSVVSELYGDPTRAQSELDYLATKMHELSLDPDVQLVTVDVTTTISKPKPYTPATEHDTDTNTTATDEPATDPIL